MYQLYLEIENVPSSLNVKLRSHWRAQRRESFNWRATIASSVDDFPEKPLTRASITLIRHGPKMLDFDGLVGSMKPVVDALKRCGVLADDSWAVTGAWNVTQKYRPKSEGVLLEILVAERPDKRN
jgi:hypothetical protein